MTKRPIASAKVTITQPTQILAGIKTCARPPQIRRAMWGAAKPTNAIAPAWLTASAVARLASANNRVETLR